MLEEHRLDIELVRLELVEDRLRVVASVVGTDARVIAPDDQVRATVVLAADRVPDRLARPRIAHSGRERRDDDALSRVVPRDERPVRLDTNRSEEHTSELQSRQYLVCRLLLEKKTQ